MRKTLVLICVAFCCYYSEASSLTAWQNFFDTLGGPSWTLCAGKRGSPCTCSFVTCDVNDDVTAITVDGNIYTGLETHEITVSMIQAFPKLSSFIISTTGNNWVRPSQDDGCFKFEFRNTGNTDDSSTCSWNGQYGFCCFERYLTDLYDNFGGSSWNSCSALRSDLCSCNPADPGIEVSCTNGVATSLKMKVMNLVTTDTTQAARTINNLVRAGATFINIRDNPGVVTEVGACEHLHECLNSDCRLPDDFISCQPTATPTFNPTLSPVPTIPPSPTPQPSTSPTAPTHSPSTSPTIAPTNSPTTAIPTVSPTTYPTHSPTTMSPTLAPVTCETANNLPEDELEDFCEESPDCFLLDNLCEYKSNVTCEKIDSLGRRQRRKHCKKIAGCGLFGLDRCRKVTGSPTMLPTSFATANPTAQKSCTDIDNQRNSKKADCLADDSCVFIKRRCFNRPEDCVQVNLFLPSKLREDACEELDGCYYYSNECMYQPNDCSLADLSNDPEDVCEQLDHCIFHDNSCVDLPENMTCSLLNTFYSGRELREYCEESNCIHSRGTCYDIPVTCEDANELNSMIRGKWCRRIDQCDFKNRQCQAITNHPTTSPTTLEEFTCEGIIKPSFGKRMAEKACTDFRDMGCYYFMDSNVCTNATDVNGRIGCSIIDQMANKRRKAIHCPEHCNYDKAKKNRANGKCFEITGCSSINNFGANTKRRRFCETRTLNGGLDCSFDKTTKMCFAPS